MRTSNAATGGEAAAGGVTGDGATGDGVTGDGVTEIAATAGTVCADNGAQPSKPRKVTITPKRDSKKLRDGRIRGRDERGTDLSEAKHKYCNSKKHT